MISKRAFRRGSVMMWTGICSHRTCDRSTKI